MAQKYYNKILPSNTLSHFGHMKKERCSYSYCILNKKFQGPNLIFMKFQLRQRTPNASSMGRGGGQW